MENKADYQISSNVNEGILEIAITGKLTEFNIPSLQEEFNSHRVAGRNRLLIDISAIDESVDVGILYHVKRPKRTIGKTAVVDRPENEQFKSYWENLTRHTPLELKWFGNIDAARDWLKCTERNRAVFFDRLNNVRNRDSNNNPQL